MYKKKPVSSFLLIPELTTINHILYFSFLKYKVVFLPPASAYQNNHVKSLLLDPVRNFLTEAPINLN